MNAIECPYCHSEVFEWHISANKEPNGSINCPTCAKSFCEDDLRETAVMVVRK